MQGIAAGEDENLQQQFHQATPFGGMYHQQNASHDGGYITGMRSVYRSRSPHRYQQQTMMDVRGRSTTLGNQQSVHGNSWVMSGANWVPARQASPAHANTIGSNICNFREGSAAPYNVKYCENQTRA